MTISQHSHNDGGPSISAIPFRHSETGLAAPLLSESERHQLALIATVVDFPRGARLYDQGEQIAFIYILSQGVVKTTCLSGAGVHNIQAFLFPEDLVGLAENGFYVSTAQAVTPVIAYRIPIAALEKLLRRDPDLKMHFLCKVCHELRAAQRHAILLARQDAKGRVALFLHLLQMQQNNPLHDPALQNRRVTVLDLPMSRADIAGYVGLSLEAVSRALRGLERDGILLCHGVRSVEITDAARFERLISAA